MSNIKINKKDKSYIINLSTVALSLIIAMSFLIHLFTYTLSGTIYAITIFALTIIYVISKNVTKTNINRFTIGWLIILLNIVFGFFRSSRTNGALLDIIIFSCGMLMIYFCSKNEKKYLQCITLVKVFALFFGAGVLLQTFFPAIHRFIVGIFPSTLRTEILTNGSGFTTNTGFSAGYIIAGIIAVASETQSIKKIKLTNFIFIILLLLALFFTGKRAPAVFLILTLLYCYLVPVKGMKKVKRYWNILIILFIAVVFFLLFKDLLVKVPFFDQIIQTIEGIIAREDVTSSRSRLYAWAIELFKAHPVFGIGWGMFRSTVVGNVTLVTELETHNIYLQILCETGLVGLFSFVIVFFMFWNATKNAYCRSIKQNYKDNGKWSRVLFFSLAYQTYFLLYGLTGNPLYDQHFQIIYILSCSIFTGYLIVEKSTSRAMTKF
nr:O-antigen ligase family protein [uncultured Sellimonas sp.]